MSLDQLTTPKAEWQWIKVATKDDMMPTEAGTTSVAVKYGDTQLAVYHVPKRGYYSTQQMQVEISFSFQSCTDLTIIPSGVLIAGPIVHAAVATHTYYDDRAFVLDHGIIGDSPDGSLVSTLEVLKYASWD
jgi:hypothetical protein